MLKILYLTNLLIIYIIGCSNPKQIEIMQEQSVGQIPCVANKIEIVQHNINKADRSGNWMALCNGRTYMCRRGSGDQTNTIDPDVSCNEMESQIPE